MRRVWIVLVSLLWSITATQAQGGGCPQIVARALELVSAACADVGRNQACYGHVDLTAIPQPTAVDFKFQQIGDITRVADLASLTLKPMNEQAGTWGVALMRLQANIPDSLPGQNVTFVLFGDVSILPTASAEGAPMQAFFLRTGIGDAPCAEAPSSGLLVQTPQGVGEVAFTVNGVDISMGSTILFRSMTGEEMTVSALEGAAAINFDGALYPVVAGTWTRMALGQASVVDRPTLPIAYVNETLEALPIGLLEREIIPREPFTPQELEKLYEFIRRGEAPCDDEEGLFPPCERLPGQGAVGEGEARWASDDDWGEPLPFRMNYEGRLLDVLLDGESLILRDDDGSECVLATYSRRESRPSCEDVLDLDWLEDSADFIQQQGQFDDFFESLDAPSGPRPPVIVPPTMPTVVVPAPPVGSGYGDDDDNDDDDDDDDD
ncbi:hypothetical protein VZO05_09485 [Aggregatilineales bacterium SYSU G02658]